MQTTHHFMPPCRPEPVSSDAPALSAALFVVMFELIAGANIVAALDTDPVCRG